MNVKVKISGQDLEGIVLHEVTGLQGSKDPMWWVEVEYSNGSRYTELFEESNLIKWNYNVTPKVSLKCTCGAASCSGPGHSYYCDLFQNGNY